MNTLERNTIVGERYLIVNLQSKDSDGEVYLAVDQASGKSVLMKRMFCYDEKQSQSLQREALVLIKLEHPNLPKFIDYFSEGSARYLVSEYISGEYLSEVVESSKKPLPLEWVIFWADQLLEVLAYLHSQSPPIIHRDIKPQNLKLMKNQDIFLFGFPLLVTSQNTKSSYVSLEEIRGSGVTERCDIYSLSATLYYLLTAQTPPDVMTRTDQVLKQFPDPLKPLSFINPNVPKEISDLVMKGMSLSPSLRYSSAKEMQRFLREIYADVKSKRSEPHLGVSALPSELKTEVLTQEDIISPAESTPVEKRFETNYVLSSSMVEVEPQKQEAQQNVLPTPQPQFGEKEVLQGGLPIDVGDDLQRTLTLEEPLEEVKLPSIEEKFAHLQNKTEILPEQIFPEVVSTKEKTEVSSSQKESVFQNFLHIPEKLSQEVSSREDTSNLTVPIIKYDELLSEEKEQAFPERQKVKTVAYEKTATLVQEGITQEHVSQPIAPQQPVISTPSKSKPSLMVIAVVSIFLVGVVLLVAGAYVFRNVLFSTATPTPTPFIETTPEPTPTVTPQVLVEQTPETIIQTSPTPSVENLDIDTANSTTFSSNTSLENKTETSQKRTPEKGERKPTSPITKQGSRKIDNQPGQEPKKTPERRLEILQ
jgi:serine/threonine protein kinase